MRGTIKMGGHVIWITFVITAQFSAVWGRNGFYEYFYSRYHHKDHSTTAGLSSSTTGISADISDISSEEKTSSSVSGDTSLENQLHSSTVDLETTVHRDTKLQGYGSGFDDEDSDDLNRRFALNAGLIGISVCVVLIVSCCLIYYMITRRRRNAVRTGFIISNNPQGIANEACPQQHAVRQQYQQPVIAQQYPPQHLEERQKLFSPQFQPQPGQQQCQYSTMLHNPPEAPPPYEFPEKF